LFIEIIVEDDWSQGIKEFFIFLYFSIRFQKIFLYDLQSSNPLFAKVG